MDLRAESWTDHRLDCVASGHHPALMLCEPFCRVLENPGVVTVLLGRQRTSAGALALGHSLGTAFIELTNSPHKQSSPPVTKAAWRVSPPKADGFTV